MNRKAGLAQLDWQKERQSRALDDRLLTLAKSIYFCPNSAKVIRLGLKYSPRSTSDTLSARNFSASRLFVVPVLTCTRDLPS